MEMNDSTNQAEESIELIDSLIDKFDVAMLITHSLNGQLHGRPMAIAGHEKGAALYFLTRSDDEKLEELLQCRDVSVSMLADGIAVSVSGRARLETSQTLIDKYWAAGARVWFPDGPSDVATTLVAVDPIYAECWDRTGARRLEFWWEAGKALLQGEKADEEALSGHAKVKLQ